MRQKQNEHHPLYENIMLYQQGYAIYSGTTQ